MLASCCWRAELLEMSKFDMAIVAGVLEGPRAAECDTAIWW